MYRDQCLHIFFCVVQSYRTELRADGGAVRLLYTKHSLAWCISTVSVLPHEEEIQNSAIPISYFLSFACRCKCPNKTCYNDGNTSFQTVTQQCNEHELAYLWWFNLALVAVVGKVHAPAAGASLRILGRFERWSFPESWAWDLCLLHLSALMPSGGTSVASLGSWDSCCSKASAQSQLILKLMGMGKARGWVVVKYRDMEMRELIEWKESELKK